MADPQTEDMHEDLAERTDDDEADKMDDAPEPTLQDDDEDEDEDEDEDDDDDSQA